MTMKADLHIHTVFSGDSEISIPKLIGHAESAGLGCVAVVDHNTVNGSKESLAEDLLSTVHASLSDPSLYILYKSLIIRDVG